ncbi:MAG TPA: phenylalanine--tRNA ligase subunit beta [Candidatus Cloacimonadota bacterium]|nr:phenylalanine--tRNA ligase subunit beta [Candidatus Cloacimonadota bacterium]HPS38910.1 phenylalanine--tRNA ligase subunit beta [Candidatus Cloacimonadota bacterium]
MKISYNWLKDYLDLDLGVEQLSDVLTFSGIEVEAITELHALPATVITAKIVSAEPVPNSDHLRLCKVDIGSYTLADKSILNADGTLDVVCGAPNSRGGMMAVLALPGTTLGEITIKSAKLRGVVSHGMLCSERELGLSDNHDGIIELDQDIAQGQNVNSLYELPDTVFELEITPNRSDLLGYQGIARDLSASLAKKLKLSKPNSSKATGIAPLKLVVKEQELCPRYIARVFDGIEIKPSPVWLRTRLIKAGLRPINNLVDITNYVLLCTGHPLHAFDYDKLNKENESDPYPAVIVRQANFGENILALDGKTYNLRESDLVIADGKFPSAIAGVMGGELTGVSANTHRIVLESAVFNHSAIRKTSYELKVSSDSSYRFERHLSDHAPAYASDLAADLIERLCGGKQVGEIIDNWATPQKEIVLGLRPERFARIIGFELSDAEIRAYLTSLGLVFLQFGNWIPGEINDLSSIVCYHSEQEKQGVTEFDTNIDCDHAHYYRIPHYRIDLEREIDLIEELARLAGYDRIPQQKAPQSIMDRHFYRIRRLVEDYLVSMGFYETLNYSFDDPQNLISLGFNPDSPQSKQIRLVNPQSVNQAAMRSSLIPSVLTDISYNLNRGERNLKLFESAKVYFEVDNKPQETRHVCAIMTGMDREENWRIKPTTLSIYHIKGIIEETLHLVGISNIQVTNSNKPYLSAELSFEYSMNDIVLAEAGRFDPQVAERFGIDTITLKQDLWLIDINIDELSQSCRQYKTEFSLIPKFPAVIRDLSFLIGDKVKFSTLMETIKGVDTEIIEEVIIFDEYRSKQIPEGFKSISLHLILRDSQKTLTDERIDTLVDSVLTKLKDNLQIELR